MKNLAGTGDTAQASQELSEAGIRAYKSDPWGECLTEVVGRVGEWEFKRLWYYWSATTADGLPIDDVEAFDAKWGGVVRAHGFAGGGALGIMGKTVRCFHIDSQAGMSALRAFLTDGAVMEPY